VAHFPQKRQQLGTLKSQARRQLADDRWSQCRVAKNGRYSIEQSLIGRRQCRAMTGLSQPGALAHHLTLFNQ
jgi:hypothetical protein